MDKVTNVAKLHRFNEGNFIFDSNCQRLLQPIVNTPALDNMRDVESKRLTLIFCPWSLHFIDLMNINNRRKFFQK